MEALGLEGLMSPWTWQVLPWERVLCPPPRTIPMWPLISVLRGWQTGIHPLYRRENTLLY